MFTTRKTLFFRSFFSFAKRPSVRKFPATIRTASSKKTTDSVIPSTCEGTEYSKDEDDVLFALEPGDTFLIFLWNNKICRPEQRVICDQHWKYLDVGKTETIYLVALNTLNASLDHDAGLEVSRYRNLKKISTCRLRYIVCVLWVMMQVFN